MNKAVQNGIITSADKKKIDELSAGSVTGVKGDAESEYRVGAVNLTAANVGAAASDHNHDSSYAAANHNHDGSYAAANHNHDGSYAAKTHTHSEYASSTHTHSAATTSAAGFMSATDKSKLDGIATGANAYSHPTTTAVTGVPTANATPGFGGTFTVNQVSRDTSGHVSAITSRTITIPSATATTVAAGLMSADDKKKLNGIAAGAQVNSVTGVKGNSESTYRTGNVNLTAANIGAAASSHTHDAATESAAGFLTATEKKFLNKLSWNSSNNCFTLNDYVEAACGFAQTYVTINDYPNEAANAVKTVYKGFSQLINNMTDQWYNDVILMRVTMDCTSTDPPQIKLGSVGPYVFKYAGNEGTYQSWKDTPTSYVAHKWNFNTVEASELVMGIYAIQLWRNWWNIGGIFWNILYGPPRFYKKIWDKIS